MHCRRAVVVIGQRTFFPEILQCTSSCSTCTRSVIYDINRTDTYDFRKKMYLRTCLGRHTHARTISFYIRIITMVKHDPILHETRLYLHEIRITFICCKSTLAYPTSTFSIQCICPSTIYVRTCVCQSPYDYFLRNNLHH